MRQPLEFKNDELEKIAENADALFNWVEEDLPNSKAEGYRVRIPARLLLVTSTIMSSGLPLLLGPASPQSVCWIGGCGGS